MTETRASIAFEEIFSKGDPFEFLKQIVTSEDESFKGLWSESEWLDYKEAGFVDAPIPKGENETETCKGRDKKVKQIWSENLAAFANTAGGILIWGVVTKKRVPTAISLAHNAGKLANRIREIQNDAVDPPIRGVIVREVLRVNQTNEGFVVCFVPPSTFSPHRAIWAEREYYMRVDDSNKTIPTPLLRRMFFPTSAPRLVPLVVGGICENSEKENMFQMTVRLANRGAASAEDVCVEIKGPFHAFPDGTLWSARRRGDNVFDCNITIHPGKRLNSSTI